MRSFLIPHSLCLLLTMGFSVSAHADPKVDATVMSVVSGGQWESTAGHGHYRIVVWQTGFEHVSTGVQAEWIDDSGDPATEARVVFTRELAAMGWYVFASPRIEQRHGRLLVRLKGIHSYANTDVSCHFELSPDGEVKTIKACS